METSELQKLVEAVSLNHFERPFRHRALFNNRLRSTGGRYHLGSYNLDFNPHVLEKVGLETFIGVIKHELCHYHLHLSGEGFQHKDKAFKDLLKQVEGLRYTPSLEAPEEPKKHWQYQCRKCGSVAQRQRRFNTAKFVCGKCKGRFELIGKVETNKTAVD